MQIAQPFQRYMEDQTHKTKLNMKNKRNSSSLQQQQLKDKTAIIKIPEQGKLLSKTSELISKRKKTHEQILLNTTWQLNNNPLTKVNKFYFNQNL